ncbi:ROK family protein [Micrococcales bacterium 31B]|nr:ROK family protein [Micrococcales bacterium 31B]
MRVIRDLGPCSRAELVNQTGLARATIEDRLTRLVDAGYVVAAQSASGTGRPAQKFRFNDDSGVFIVADVGSTHTRVGVTSLNCELLGTREVPLPLDAGARTLFASVAESAMELLGDLGLAASAVRGFGGGTPGAIDTAGTHFMPRDGWGEEDLIRLLRDELSLRGLGGFPLELDRDANIMTLGEMRTSFPHIRDMLVVKVGMAVSCGIAANGVLLRGAHGFAGDIAHRPLAADDVPPTETRCRCGLENCAEPMMSGAGIAAELRGYGHEFTTSRQIRTLAGTGDALAQAVLGRAARRLGIVISGAVRTLNPELIVIGGNLADQNSSLIEMVRAAILENSHPLVTAGLSIVGSSITVDAGMLGAAHLIRDALLEPRAVDLRLNRGEGWL